METKRTGRGSDAERLDARLTVVTVRQRPTASDEVLTETRLLGDGFQAEET